MSEVVAKRLSKTRAKALQKEIIALAVIADDALEQIPEKMAEFVSGRGWEVLGYPSLTEAFEGLPTRFKAEIRNPIIVAVAQTQEALPPAQRLRHKEIGALVGTSADTVDRVTRSTMTASAAKDDLDHASDQEKETVIDAEIVDDSIAGINPYNAIREQRLQNPRQSRPEDTPEDAAKWIPAYFEAINADLDAITDLQYLADEHLKEQLREEITIIRDKLAKIEELCETS